MNLLVAQNLGFSYPGHELFSGLNCTIGPGLTLVRGGDGRGKTTLLKILAGQCAPTSGQLVRQAQESWFEDPRDPVHRHTVARAWLQAGCARHPAWSEAQADKLIEAFDLSPHMAKPLYMLSTGSARKLGWVAAVASGAPMTLLDGPHAALDAPSCAVLDACLRAAAHDPLRAWVLAAYEAPPGLAQVPWVGVIDLGD